MKQMNNNPCVKAISLSGLIEDINEIASVKEGISANDCPIVFEVDGKLCDISEYKLRNKPQTSIIIKLNTHESGKYFNRPTEKNTNKYKVNIQEDLDDQCPTLLHGVVKSKTDAEIIGDMVCDVLGTICPYSGIRFENGKYQYIFSCVEFDLYKLKQTIKDNDGYVDWYTLYKCSKNN